MARNETESHGLTYDVFISFRGEDTRHKFIGHLRKELFRRRINAFLDDKHLELGVELPPALSKAIQESRIFILVFSQNYASSTWCLDELSKILELSKTRGTKSLVFPIFYHVNPLDVQRQRNSYEDHMMAHEKRFVNEPQKVQAWRSALSEACNLVREPKMEQGSEIDLIENIVKKVYENVTLEPFDIGRNTVGLGPRIEQVKSLLDMNPDCSSVRMLGIHGLGGVGKTELAKALYDEIVQHFDAACFLADVREKSNRINGLEDLQKTVLSELFKEIKIELGSTSGGIYEIKHRLHRMKVLLVLDDVDEKDSLEKLAGGCEWFGLGSRIIITTRNKNVLIAHQVDETYEMIELDEKDSLELFCWNAFKQSHPKTGFLDVSSRAVDVAKRLPLALKVMGSDLATLNKKSSNDWERALEEYEKIHPNEMIQEVLKISYDRLHDNSKQVFLDIACFFKGEKKEYVKRILEEFGATSSINVLCDKSLLTIEDDCLKMHDLIQDMGRDIVRQEAPHYPGQRSRLWDYEDVREILTEDSGSKKIQGIMFDPPHQEEVNWSGNSFAEMKWLRILIIRNTTFSTKPKHLPNHLRVLDWEEFHSKSFPLKFHPKKITVFSLPRSHLTLEESFKKFSCLTNMDFSYNQSITELPDVSQVQNLREMRLDHCRNLIAVHYSIGFLKRLAHLSVSECSKLRNFPPRIFLPSLEVLDLNLCVSLEHFPEIMQEMSKALKIYMINTSIQELPESISNLTGLVSIDMSNNRELKYLPSSLFMLPNVVSFKIEACSKLRESFRSLMLHPSKANVRPKLRSLNFGNGNLSDEDLFAILCYFPKLEELIASENNFVSLPTCIKGCVDLTSLDLNGCIKLKKVPKCTNLRILDVHRCLYLEEISELSSTLHKVDARSCFKLTRETSDMLWYQVKRGVRGVEVVMPFTTEIPEWFNFVGLQRNPRFWVRSKFPNIALAMIFHFQDESERDKFARRRLVHLRLLINGRYVPCKGYHNIRIEAEHVLICDLRVLFSEKEWLGLDALLEEEWNLVQVAYEATSSLMISGWGAFVYEEGTNMEDLLFTCPNPMYSEEMPLAIVPTKDPKEKDKMMIENLGLDQSFNKTMKEWLDSKERGGFEDEYMHTLLGELKKLSEDAENALKSNGSALEDPNSYLRWLLDKIENDEGKPNVFFKGDLALIRLEHPVTVKKDNTGEASTSGNHRSNNSEKQGYDPLLQAIMQEYFYDGMTDGLLEAQNRFPSLDVVETRNVALNKGIRIAWSREGKVQIPSAENRTYMSGIYGGLFEAKLRFPDLDIWATLNTVASRRDIHINFVAPPTTVPHFDWTKVIPSDPLSLVMKRQCRESEAESKQFKKLKQEHQVLRNRFLQLEGEKANAASDDDTSTTSSGKNLYEELIQKLNTEASELVPKKVGCTDDLQSPSSSTEMHRDNGCKCDRKYEKVRAILKGRAEELRRLYDAGIEGFEKTEEFQDLVSAMYLNGLGDGLLEAQAITLALYLKML